VFVVPLWFYSPRRHDGHDVNALLDAAYHFPLASEGRQPPDFFCSLNADRSQTEG
jgi:hypothetical protein